MTRGLRTALWVLSSLAMLWTVLAVVGWLRMGGMTGCCGMMGGGMMRGMADTGMGGQYGMMGGAGMRGAWGAGMLLHMVLTWLIVLGLDGVFIYLMTSARRGRSALVPR